MALNQAGSRDSWSFIIIFTFLHNECLNTRFSLSCRALPVPIMSLAIVRSWADHTAAIMPQFSSCCIVCLISQLPFFLNLSNRHSIFSMLILGWSTLSEAGQVLPRLSSRSSPQLTSVHSPSLFSGWSCCNRLSPHPALCTSSSSPNLDSAVDTNTMR